MALGSNIHRLRINRNMSQGDLADALGVSRQSISKWETDGAVPELDKLVKLSQIFGVSLDELVHGAPTAPPQATQPEPAPAAKAESAGKSRHKTVALVLLGLAIFCLACCTVLGAPAVGIILMLPFLLGSIVSLLSPRHPILSACWAILILVDMYLRFATGLSWATIRLTHLWSYELNYFRLFTAWMQFLCITCAVLCTVFAFRKKPISMTGKEKTRYILGWVGVVGVSVLMRLSVHTLNFNFLPWRMLNHLLDWCRILLFTAQLSSTVRWLRCRKSM